LLVTGVDKRMKNFICAIAMRCVILAAVIATIAGAAWAGADSPDQFEPVADAKAMVTTGHARFTVLTPELIRMEWAADGKFEDHASLVFLNRRLPVPKFTQVNYQSGGDTGVTLRTSALTLIYRPEIGGDGKFTSDNLSITLHLNGADVVWTPGTRDTGNLLGTVDTLDGVTGGNINLEPGLVSRNGWVVVDDTMRPLFDSADFSFEKGEASVWPWVMARPAGERQDWYFFGYGHEYKRALHDFTRVAGKIPLPPRFAFGAWWSRYWSYTDQEFEELVHNFRTHEVPLDVLVIDMDWHPTFGSHWWDNKLDPSGHVLGWTGYTWNKLLFPDPPDFLADIHRQGLKATINMHPGSGVQEWEESYPQMARAMGIDPATKKYVPFDLLDKKFATNYMNVLHHPLEKQGIDFFWLDWQEESTTKFPTLTPIWWLNYVHFTDQEREGKRPLLFHRWGGLGNHRYEIGFSGDTVSVWDSLAFQPYFTATAANVGYAYWSHDIGGHEPGPIEPELFLRWIQFGEFSPILRTHTAKNPDSERRVWAYPEPYADLMREAFVQRYALEPYIYTEARRTYDTGVAFLHPLYYEAPEAAEAYSVKDEYFFGDELLVAPVTRAAGKETQLASRTVWLPEGEWFEWQTGAHFKGPIMLVREASIQQIPVYAKAGSIVPMQPQMKYTGEKAVDPLLLKIFPLQDGQTSAYKIYEDAGNSTGYKRGEEAFTKIQAALSSDGAALRVTISPVEGKYAGMQTARGYEVRLPGTWPPERVTVNGQPVALTRKEDVPGWHYEGNTLETVIQTARFGVAAAVTVELKYDLNLVAQRALLDSFAGKMMRLRETYDILNALWPTNWTPDALVDAMQTGDRLTYHPETAAADLGRLQNTIASLPKLIEGMRTTEDSKAFQAVARDKRISEDKPAQDQLLAHYNGLVDLALAHLADIGGGAAQQK
jgi:alpha-glucosidase (family GH31 glycosyl hydrolase)